MAININWGDVLKTAGPVLGSMAAAKAGNRGFETVTNQVGARDAEAAAVNRANAMNAAGTLELARQREAREAAADAFKQAQTAALMKNMQDVSFDRSGFRSKVPTVSFQGGSRPSAFGAEGKNLADIMQNRSLQTLMAPQGGGGPGSQAVPRGGLDASGMPAYQAAEVPEEGFWEKALGVAGLGATVAGSMPGLFGQGAAAATPSVAAQVARNPMGGVGTPNFNPNPVNFAGAAPGAAGAVGGAAAGAARAAPGAVSFLGGGGGAGGLSGVSFGGQAAKGIPISFGGQTFTSPTMASSLAGSGTTGASTAAKTAGTAGAAGAKGSSGLAKFVGATSGGASGALGAANMVAGPAGLAAGLIAPYLPAGKARTAADWASKGATVGSFIPGVGTAIGAGVGAAAGAIKGHQNATKPAREKLAKTLGYGTLANLNKALEGMGPEGQRLLDQGLHVIGKHDTKGNDAWIQQVATLLGRR